MQRGTMGDQVAQWQCWEEMGRSHRPMGKRALTCLAKGGWTVGPPVSGGLFDFFRCRKKKCWCCCRTTVTERFLTAEGARPLTKWTTSACPLWGK